MPRCPLPLVAALLALPFALGEDKKPADLPAELPKIKPLEPANALKAFDVPPGFKVELVAAEPLLRSPVAMDFDENGRLFVAEFPEYNQYANPNGSKDAAASDCSNRPRATASTTSRACMWPIWIRRSRWRVGMAVCSSAWCPTSGTSRTRRATGR